MNSETKNWRIVYAAKATLKLITYEVQKAYYLLNPFKFFFPTIFTNRKIDLTASEEAHGVHASCKSQTKDPQKDRPINLKSYKVGNECRNIRI